MNKLFWGILIAAAVGVFVFAGTRSKDNTATVQQSKPSFAAIQTDLQNQGKLYDVRTAEEYASGHIKEATNFSLQGMQAGKLPDVAKDTKIYVYCHSGNRSSQATAILKQSGYTNITDLGAMTNVQAMGGAITK